MRIIFRTHPALRECLIGIRIDGAGSVWDPFPGAHHLLEHLVSTQVEEAITQLGGRYDTFTYREYQTHTFALPLENVAEGLRQCSQALRAVSKGGWTDQELKDVIQLLRQERLVHERNPHERLMESLDEAVLCPAYARPTSVIEPPVPLQATHVAALARRAFQDDRATVVCLSPDERCLQLVEHGIDLPQAEMGIPLFFPKCRRSISHVETYTTMDREAFIRFDLPGFGLASPLGPINRIASAFLAGSIGLLRRALGDAGAGSCYDIFSDSAQFAWFGQVDVGAACAPEQLERVHHTALDVLARLYEKPFVSSDQWHRLEEETKKDVQTLQDNPYELFEFLLEEAHPCFCGEVDPQLLLVPWQSKQTLVEKALRTIFNPKTVSVGKINYQRRANHTLVSRVDEP